jgi:hypothetical protein
MGSIANRLDRDRVTRTVLEVTNLMARREAIFAEHNIDSMATYRRARRRGEYADADPYGDVFLVVDGWYTVRQDFDDIEDNFTEIAARGLSFGIHLVIAANRWSEMRPWLRDVVGTRFELKLGDRSTPRSTAGSPPRCRRSPAGASPRTACTSSPRSPASTVPPTPRTSPRRPSNSPKHWLCRACPPRRRSGSCRIC